ncbi:3-isopropylmalate dehydrogenase [Candidatus Roizmanbacteria bacterium RIFCSPHIGHO2_02_FULL_39_9]|uniref:3-isopropylmalate dehydrogenase n=1 Tax=Candidatus Roizmanbacteria bacterium RIFCSPHIGHO2_02_FULL_39_9 TaxID=1802040 RepID=A0A1F7H8Q5_9BACT|nr:MAG: 3-isopropylmalate dehydrogenase [Candidatus Roizmanbacteria bacterium RIFCSPHIGHO2_02_FULL_39_9]
MKKNIAVLPGDGVGPEVIREAVKVLKKIGEVFGHSFTFTEGLIGAAAIEKVGNPYPEETHELCTKSDAILFGAIGDPKYDNDPKAKVRPEQGLLKMRKSLNLFANIRPVFVFDPLISSSPLKPEIVKQVDFVVIRELTGGIYFGEPRGRRDQGKTAFDTCVYSEEEILRIAKVAYDIAGKRRKKVTVVDKANVLETSRLWRETIQKFSKKYPDIETHYMFVDNAAMQIIKKPVEFDVILTENMFGDILTDEASMISGSLGMLPSASIGSKTALYEPIHGSYPKATGKNSANPIAAILSVEMLLKYSFNMFQESHAVFQAIKKTLDEGWRTGDIANNSTLQDKIIGTKEMGEKIIKNVS